MPFGTERSQPLNRFKAKRVRHTGERSPLIERFASPVVVPGHRLRANTESARSFPVSRPLASGTLARMPTCLRTASGKTRSSGFTRNMLKMIWTLWTRG